MDKGGSPQGPGNSTSGASASLERCPEVPVVPVGVAVADGGRGLAELPAGPELLPGGSGTEVPGVEGGGGLVLGHIVVGRAVIGGLGLALACGLTSGQAQGRGLGVLLVVALAGGGGGGVETPLGQQGLVHLLGLGELEGAGLLGHDGALVLGLELGHQLGDEPAGLLGVEVTHLLGHIDQGGDHLVVTLLLSLLVSAASSANLNGELLAGSISDKLARLFLHILGGAGGLIHSPALLWSLIKFEIDFKTFMKTKNVSPVHYTLSRRVCSTSSRSHCMPAA